MKKHEVIAMLEKLDRDIYDSFRDNMVRGIDLDKITTRQKHAIMNSISTSILRVQKKVREEVNER